MSHPLLPFPWLDLVLILALIALNGVLSMSELAIVSSREARLKAMVKSGSSGAKVALSLAAEPGRFLSTVQTGITLIGMIDVCLVVAIAVFWFDVPLRGSVALLFAQCAVYLMSTLGLGLVIVVTTFASLVIGEIVPKQFALRSPEPIAAIVARPLYWMAKVTAPFVWLLDTTSSLIFKALRLDRESRNAVTAEELHLVVAEAHTAGVLDESEREIISGIVRLADRPVREVMTPRTDVDWIDVHSTGDQIRTALKVIPHSRIPVADGSVDNIVGVVQARDLLTRALDGQPLDLKGLCRQAPVIPDLMDAMDALAVLRAADVPLALVHDEYGHLDGIVTPGSILAALAGAFSSDLDDDTDPPLVERDDGSWLISGAASADLLTDRLGIPPRVGKSPTPARDRCWSAMAFAEEWTGRYGVAMGCPKLSWMAPNPRRSQLPHERYCPGARGRASGAALALCLACHGVLVAACHADPGVRRGGHLVLVGLARAGGSIAPPVFVGVLVGGDWPAALIRGTRSLESKPFPARPPGGHLPGAPVTGKRPQLAVKKTSAAERTGGGAARWRSGAAAERTGGGTARFTEFWLRHARAGRKLGAMTFSVRTFRPAPWAGRHVLTPGDSYVSLLVRCRRAAGSICCARRCGARR